MRDKAEYANMLTMHCSASCKDIYLKRASDYVSDRTISVEPAAFEELLQDPIITKVASMVDLATLSILELLEYDLGQLDINKALAKGVISFDKVTSPPAHPAGCSEGDVLALGDYYYGFLDSKVRLTDLCIYLLKITECRTSSVADPLEKSE